VPWANGVQAHPLELPFPLAWQMVGIVVTTLVIAGVHALDRRADALEERPGTGHDPGER